jgi:hypothetical protein
MAPYDDTLPPRIEAALQDPSLRTDERLMLRRQLIALLEPHAQRIPAVAPHPRAADDGELSRLAEAALRDPSLPTDERMALSRRLTELLHGRE